MRMVVLGGTGTLGAAIVEAAVGAGHDVTALSRRAPARPPSGARHTVANVVTGDGLDGALSGAEVLVDATNGRGDRRGDPERVLIGGTRRVLERARQVGVRHFVGISIVGIDGAPMAYYRVKVAQEEIVAAGGVPWSILRATQFHDLVARYAAGRHGIVFAPLGWRLQPIDVREVAAALVGAAGAPPGGRLPDVAGPEVLVFRDAARAWARAARRRRLIVPVIVPGPRGTFLRSGRMCAPERAVGEISFAAWLAARYGAAPGAPG